MTHAKKTRHKLTIRVMSSLLSLLAVDLARKRHYNERETHRLATLPATGCVEAAPGDFGEERAGASEEVICSIVKRC